MLLLLPAMQMKRFSCRCRYTSKRYKRCTTKVAAHRILSIRSHVEDEPEISIYQVRGHDVALPSPALPRPVAAPSLPLLCLNMGILKRHMEFMRAQGLRRCFLALSGHSQSEWQTENDKEATAANKEKCRQWSRELLGRRGRQEEREQSGGKAAWKVLPTYLSLGHF